MKYSLTEFIIRCFLCLILSIIASIKLDKYGINIVKTPADFLIIVTATMLANDVL